VTNVKWSYSAHRDMRTCERRLIFGYLLASHSARDPNRHEAYILKQLQHVSAWQGSVVHKILATELVPAMRRGQRIDIEALIPKAHEMAKRQFQFSASQRYRSVTSKLSAGIDYCALFEHERGLKIGEHDLQSALDKIELCLNNLGSQLEFLSLIRSGNGHIAELPLSFSFHGVRVVAIPDLLFNGAAANPILVDWKISGSETSDYSRQLLLQALALTRTRVLAAEHPERIEVYEANLLKNKIVRHPVTTERLEDAENLMYRSVTELLALTEGEDPSEIDPNDFEVADRPSTCLHCNFAPLCIRYLEGGNQIETAQLIQGRLF
jgi:hypothetical protein